MGNDLRLTDAGDTISLTDAARQAGAVSDGPHTIRVPAAKLASLAVNTPAPGSSLTVLPLQIPLAIQVPNEPFLDLTVDDTPDPSPQIMDLNANLARGLFTLEVQSTADNPGGTFTPATIQFQAAGLHTLTLMGGGGGNTFTLGNTPLCPTVLDSGTGADAVTVLGTLGPLAIEGQDGRDQVTVGQPSGSPLTNFRGPITVDNDNALTDLIVDNRRGFGGHAPLAGSHRNQQPALCRHVHERGAVSRPRAGRSPEWQLHALVFRGNCLRPLAAGLSLSSPRPPEGTVAVTGTPEGLTTTVTTGHGAQMNVLGTTGLLKVLDQDSSAVVTQAAGTQLEHILGRGSLSPTGEVQGVFASPEDADQYTLTVTAEGNLYLPGEHTAQPGSVLDGPVDAIYRQQFSSRRRAPDGGRRPASEQRRRGARQSQPPAPAILAARTVFPERYSDGRHGGGLHAVLLVCPGNQPVRWPGRGPRPEPGSGG